jgi:DNA-binding LacI/PurR family transcriptional regulator
MWESMMAITLKDVAAHAGVSVQTVSNVINGRSAHVGEQTRLQVLASIEALQYRPNMAARHLRKASVGVIALAVPDFVNAYFAEVATLVIQAARERGYTVLIDATGADREQESLVANGLRPHLIDGLILDAQALKTEDLLPDRRPIPIVLLGEGIFDNLHDHVVMDNVAAAHMLTAHLISVGRRRIAAIGVAHAKALGASTLRTQGFRMAHEEAGLAVDPTLLVRVEEWWRRQGAESMAQLLARPDPPDAVFCFNDLLALGAIHAIRAAGYRVPEDIAVAGIDDIDDGRFAHPQLTTIAPDKRQIARLAVSLLLGRIDGTRTGPPECINVDFQLIARGSTVGAPTARHAPAPAVILSHAAEALSEKGGVHSPS